MQPTCNCHDRCCTELCDEEDELRKLQYDIHNGNNKHETDTKLLQFIRETSQPGQFKKPGCKKKYKLLGKTLCTAAFSSALGIGRKRADQIAKKKDEGWRNEAPPDMRAFNGKSNKINKQRESVDNFFNFTYTFVAQPGAEEDENIQEHLDKGRGNRILEWIQGQQGNVVAAASVGLDGEKSDAKFIPWQTWQDLYEGYLLHSRTMSDQASIDCFKAVFTDVWSNRIIFLGKVEHKRCSCCAELNEQDPHEQDPHERQLLENAYKDHIDRNTSDRCMDARLEHLSELSTMLHCLLAHRSMLVRIDGLDQAKTKLPRNLEDSKTWASLWRPQMHCIGVLVEGLLEAYFLADEDLTKGSNMELSLIHI